MPDYAAIRDNFSNPVVFDGRNILDPKRVDTEGIVYFGIGTGQTALLNGMLEAGEPTL